MGRSKGEEKSKNHLETSVEAEDLRAPKGQVWVPQPGPQVLATMCPADIIFFGGSRGGGKSDCAIGKQVTGAVQYGYAWNGLFLRKNFKHFAELRRRIDELIRLGLPAHRIGGDGQTNTIRFDNGAKVLLTAVEREEQLDFFQGQQFSLICIEEACQFAFISNMIEKLKACLRSPHGVPCKMFLTGNPGGAGHNQVKSRFITPAPQGGVPIPDGDEIAIFIPSSVDDNKVLCDNDPKYVNKLKSIKDPKLRAAWLYGDWDVVAGGYFDDVWDAHAHILPRFSIPRHWPRGMSIDWGSATPFSIGWYAISAGDYVPELKRSLPRGAIVRYREWYGCVKDQPNVGLRLNSTQVAQGALEAEIRRGESDLMFDRIGDPKMWKQDDGPSVAERMSMEGLALRPGDNQRIPGWDLLRWYLSWHEVKTHELPPNGHWQKAPMFYVTQDCDHFIRTVPILERHEKDFEDISAEQEDHVADEARYFVMSRQTAGLTIDELSTHQKTFCEADIEEIEDSNFMEETDDFYLPV